MLQIRFYMKRNIRMRWFNQERHKNLSNEEHDFNWWSTQLSSFEDWNNETYDKDKLHRPTFKMR